MTENNQKYEIDPYIWVMMIITFLATTPGIAAGIFNIHLAPAMGTLIFGIAIFGGAFILSWAAEAIQVDISESLAIAILALLAVLPEYAVDFVFTWNSAHDPSQAHYAIANMTGANRLLVGLGWPFILFLFVFLKKKKAVILDPTQRVEIFYLAIATLYSFTIPLKGELTLIDTVILVTLFGMYTRHVAQQHSAEPELVGPPKILANQSKIPRRIITYAFFAYAGTVIFFVTEPFTESLVSMGEVFGIDEFLLVQWLAPIASESPEFIIAAVWTSRGAASSAMKALISSKVNQWTLLVGTIPLVYAISGQAIKPFALDTLQKNELYLTAAQSLFAVAILISLKLDKKRGALLLVLFLAQLIFKEIRLEVAAIYIVLAVFFFVMNRRKIIPTIKVGLGLKE